MHRIQNLCKITYKENSNMKIARKNTTSYIVDDCLTIKLTNQSEYYQCYFSIAGEKIRKSTGFKNKDHAADFAINLYNKINYEISNDLYNKSTSFKKLTERYLKTIETDKKYKFHKETTKRHFLHFFSRFDKISKIELSDLDDYLICRRSKVNGNVQNSTLNKENAVFNGMMKYALKHKLIDEQIKFEKQKEELNPRPPFTENQYTVLIKTAKKRIKEFTKLKGQAKGLHSSKLNSRLLALDIIEILANTGLRPCELKTVKWKDVDITNKTIKLNNAGKVKSNRLLYVRTKAGLLALERLKQRRLNYLQAKCLKNNDIEQEYIQSNVQGIKILSVKKAIKGVINDCDFQYEDNELKHSMYSLRHTYANFAITGKKGKRVGITALSRQMGTEIQMIEKHYGHDSTEDYAHMLIN